MVCATFILGSATNRLRLHLAVAYKLGQPELLINSKWNELLTACQIEGEIQMVFFKTFITLIFFMIFLADHCTSRLRQATFGKDDGEK